MTTPEPRPTVVTVAISLLLIGAAMLIAGGLQGVTFGFDALRRLAPSSVSDSSVRSYLTSYRAAGALFVAAGAGLAFLTERTRRRDARSRRATVGLGLAIVSVWAAAVIFDVGYSVLIPVALVPTIAGVVLLSRQAAITWFYPDLPVVRDD